MESNTLTAANVRQALRTAKAARRRNLVVPTATALRPYRAQVREWLRRAAAAQAWITPGGRVEPAPAHEQWLKTHDLKPWGLDIRKAPQDETALKLWAIQKGFVRLNFEQRSGTLNLEAARGKLTAAIKDAILEYVIRHASEIWNIRVQLLDAAGHCVGIKESPVFRYEDNEKAEHIPYVTASRKRVAAFAARSSAQAGWWVHPLGVMLAPKQDNRPIRRDYAEVWYLPAQQLLRVKAVRLMAPQRLCVAAIVAELGRRVQRVAVSVGTGARREEGAVDLRGLSEHERLKHLPYITA